jgi:hypothetical protein
MNARTTTSSYQPSGSEYDNMLWQERMQGSTEQKLFRAKFLTPSGSVSPFRTLTHGLPSGESQDDKKYTKLKIAGGDMASVLQN